MVEIDEINCCVIVNLRLVIYYHQSDDTNEYC